MKDKSICQGETICKLGHDLRLVYIYHINFDCSPHTDFYILYDVSLEVKLHTGA